MIAPANTPETLPVELSADRVWRLFKELPDGRYEPTGLVMVAPAGFLMPSASDVKPAEPAIERMRKCARAKAERAAMRPSLMDRIGATLEKIDNGESVVANLPQPIERDAQPDSDEAVFYCRFANVRHPWSPFVVRGVERQYLGTFATLEALLARHPHAEEWRPRTLATIV